MHTAKAATEWAALLELKVCPCPDAQVLWHAISIVPCDLKSVRVLGDKPVITFTHQDGQDFSWLNLKPRVGDRFAATVFCDQSGMVSDGMTVATQPVHQIATRGAFKLLQTLDRADHYVLVTEHAEGGAT